MRAARLASARQPLRYATSFFGIIDRKLVPSFMMLLGWGILAVPTGIVTAEMTAQGFALRAREQAALRHCGACGSGGHEPQARFCKDCGAALAGGEPGTSQA